MSINPAYGFITKTKDQLYNPTYITHVANNGNLQSLIIPNIVGYYNVYILNFQTVNTNSRALLAPSAPLSFVCRQLKQPLNQFDSKSLNGYFNWNITPNDVTFNRYPMLGNYSNKIHLGAIKMDGRLDFQTIDPTTGAIPAGTNFVAYEFEFEYLGNDFKNATEIASKIPRHLRTNSIPRCLNINANGTRNYIRTGLKGDFIMEIAMYQMCQPTALTANFDRIISLTSPQFQMNGANDIANISGQYYNGNSILLPANYRNLLVSAPIRLRCRLDDILDISVWDITNNAILPVVGSTYPIISLHVNFREIKPF